MTFELPGARITHAVSTVTVRSAFHHNRTLARATVFRSKASSLTNSQQVHSINLCGNNL